MGPKRPLESPGKSNSELTAPKKINVRSHDMDQAGTSGEESAGLPLAEPMTECSSSSEGECTENETGSNVKRSLTLNNGNAMMGSDSPPPWFSTFVDKFESRFTRLEQTHGVTSGGKIG